MRFGPWGLINDQVAILTDAVRQMEFTLARVNGNDWKPPEPTPRPGITGKRLIRKQSVASVSYLNTLRAKGGT